MTEKVQAVISSPSVRRAAYLGLVLALVALVLAHSLLKFIPSDNLNTAASAGNLAAMNALLSSGANLEGRSLHDMTPLMSAAKGGHSSTVLALLAKGANVNAHNDSGSVLMWAAASGNAITVRALLNKGVNVNWQSSLGDTALKMAQEYKHPGIIQMLRQAGAT